MYSELTVFLSIDESLKGVMCCSPALLIEGCSPFCPSWPFVLAGEDSLKDVKFCLARLTIELDLKCAISSSKWPLLTALSRIEDDSSPSIEARSITMGGEIAKLRLVLKQKKGKFVNLLKSEGL